MNILRSIAAVGGGLTVGYLVDRWLVFPIILHGAKHLTSGELNAHRMVYAVIMIVVELGTAVLCSGVTIGLVAPNRPRVHALATGVIGGIGSLAIGPAGKVPQLVRAIGFAIQTVLFVLIASRVARWRDRPKALPVATA
jgi:hypothetical protein